MIKNQLSGSVKETAKGRWPWILERLGIAPEYLRNQHGPCPVCGGTDRFRFDDRDGSGSFYCNGCDPTSGDGWTLLQLVYGWTFAESVRHVQEILGAAPALPVVSSPPNAQWTAQAPNKKALESINRAWSVSVETRPGDPVFVYLNETRRLALLSIPKALRHHTECCTRLQDDNMHRGPAMIAAVRNVSGELIQIHRTFLTPDGRKDLSVGEPKKLMASPYAGATSGCAVQLFEPTDLLAIAEGIETALAVHKLFGVPAWASLTAGLLEFVEVPDTVREVLIFADNDQQKTDRGYVAARKLARRLTKQGKLVRIREPIEPGADFADLLR